MKTNIVIIALSVVFSVAATGQTNPMAATASAATTEGIASEPAANEIVTLTGATYKNVQIQKVEPDGLTISYAPAGGGIGATKIPFDELSTNLQAKYGYDFEKAAQYQARQQKAMGQWREKLITDEAAARARRAAEEAAVAQATNSVSTNSMPTNSIPTSEVLTNSPPTNNVPTHSIPTNNIPKPQPKGGGYHSNTT